MEDQGNKGEKLGETPATFHIISDPHHHRNTEEDQPTKTNLKQTK